MRDAEEVAREVAVYGKTGLAIERILTEWQAEVRAEALAGFEREGDGEIGPCVNTDHADAHAMPGPAWSGPDCRHEWQVTRHRLVGPWEPVKEPEP